MFLALLTIVSQLFNLAPLHEQGFTGEGITIAVIDGGFFRANEECVFPQDQIIAYYDLVREDYLHGDTMVVDTMSMFGADNDVHGTKCLSTMLYRDSVFSGTAPGAHFILIKSEENARESLREVYRLARAIHLADSLGADIITISLGYSEFDDPTTNYTYDDLDGSSPCSVAATEAARHGKIVCVSAGNSGNKPWRYITPPADAYDILAVGAVKQDSTAADFTSYGLGTDGRQKPEVSSLGYRTTVFASEAKDAEGQYVGKLTQSNGTSFSCPQVAGMAACLWQALPHLTATELRQLIMESGHAYTQPDCRIGYGIPDAWQAYQRMATKIEAAPIDAASKQGRIVYRNGQLFIEKDGKFFTLLGQVSH